MLKHFVSSIPAILLAACMVWAAVSEDARSRAFVTWTEGRKWRG